MRRARQGGGGCGRSAAARRVLAAARSRPAPAGSPLRPERPGCGIRAQRWRGNPCGARPGYHCSCDCCWRGSLPAMPAPRTTARARGAGDPGDAREGTRARTRQCRATTPPTAPSPASSTTCATCQRRVTLSPLLLLWTHSPKSRWKTVEELRDASDTGSQAVMQKPVTTSLATG
ncbi:mCG7386 [Mus musculus]|nr:mCG7386 [Mus musculus]